MVWSFAVHNKYRSAVMIFGPITVIAAYHYIRIFNSRVGADSYPQGKVVHGEIKVGTPELD